MQKNLGIIGGMGPEATCVLFERVIKGTDAKRDQDHINITILNDPSIPDRTAFLLKEEGAQDFTAPIPAVMSSPSPAAPPTCSWMTSALPWIMPRYWICRSWQPPLQSGRVL